MTVGRLDWLYERFRERLTSPFMIGDNGTATYAWLLDRVAHWNTRLDAEGVARGAVAAIEGDYAPDVVALLLALIERDAILVPLTSSVEANKAEFLTIAEVEVVVSFLGSSDGVITHRPGAAHHALTLSLRQSGVPGLVLFSSGSTGKSKAAIHDLSRLLDKFRPRRHCFVTLTFLLLDHIGGINTLLYILSNVGTVVSTNSRDPDVICRAIALHRVELLPTSPTFLNLLLISEAWQRHDLTSLTRITYGTEVMPAQTLQKIHEILPAVELQQTYGLSELGILRSKSKGPDSLFVKLGGEGFETKVVDATLWVRAHSAMLGYLNAPSPFDADGWFNTGDAVEVEGEYVKILGRKSELINVGGAKVYPNEVENVLLQMPNVRDAVVVGEKHPITGHIVVARLNLFEPEDTDALKRRVREFCRARLEGFKVPARIVVVEDDQFSLRFKKMRL